MSPQQTKINELKIKQKTLGVPKRLINQDPEIKATNRNQRPSLQNQTGKQGFNVSFSITS